MTNGFPRLTPPARTNPAKRIFAGIALTAAVLLAGAVHAAYPERPIQLIISFPPAGATDILARAIGQKLTDTLGQPVIVENRPGAGGGIGLAAAAKASPDGYTIYLAAVTNLAIAAAAYPSQPAHLIRQFTPVAGIASVPHILVVPATLPVQNVGQLTTYLKASPGKYNFASQGSGTLSHLESELFKIVAGVDMVHVPYKGSSQALPDLIAGSLSMMFDSIPASMPHIKSGKLRVLAVASTRRAASLPNVPTVQESGVTGFEANNVFGFSVPKGTPPAVIGTLSKAIETVLAAPDLKQRMEIQGVELKFTPGEEFSRITEQEYRQWSKVVETAKVKIE